MQKHKNNLFFRSFTHIYAHGITLIELIITIAVLSIVIAAGTPFFADMVSRNQQSADFTNMKSFLQNARKQAISRRGYVTLCARKLSIPANAEPDCYAEPSYDASNNPWINGWVMHISRQDPLNISDTAHIIKSQDALRSVATLSGRPGYIRFSPHGESYPLNTTISFCPSKVTGTVYAQEIILSNGRIRTRKNATLCSQ